ncbi:Crp/Fnr family transcriptional regulator [Bradyrhizobium zhanjiangense]|uniref:Crp/Fnr family transcriptional regulator n=1 Tax=Bradyrhizobium zhanjiangense TaxID=1325107 RepID=A0A4Q0QKX1_9BRAD|nr:Crp/Fnr family transcriptional regulator [Bradyrhizobium zhanjiangense]RXG94617.1 Crp/Fnr family transcriptional regulator [Bradyrhizobium zhanjiangense]
MADLPNCLLKALSPSDAAALQPHLRSVRLRQQQVLYEAGRPIALVYFPTGAVISLVVELTSGASVEAAMVGLDGVVGATAALNGRKSLSRAVVQLAGSSMVCDVGDLGSIAMQSVSMLSILIRHEQALLAQAQQSAACMSSHTVEARLCRWLLRARDLAGSDTLDFTQEFLAGMLGTQRTSVTLSAQTLQKAGLIEYKRGKIRIQDANRMREAVCECYQAVKDQYAEVVALSD